MLAGLPQQVSHPIHRMESGICRVIVNLSSATTKRSWSSPKLSSVAAQQHGLLQNLAAASEGIHYATRCVDTETFRSTARNVRNASTSFLPISFGWRLPAQRMKNRHQ